MRYNLQRVESLFLGVPSLHFDRHIQLCKHQHNQDTHKMFPSAHKLGPLVVSFLSPPPAPGNHWSDFCPVVVPFPECHINGPNRYVAFCPWLLSLSIVRLRVMHAVACVTISTGHQWLWRWRKGLWAKEYRWLLKAGKWRKWSFSRATRKKCSPANSYVSPVRFVLDKWPTKDSKFLLFKPLCLW